MPLPGIRPGMKAIAISEYGGPEVLRYAGMPDPKIGPEGVLIRVKAASVNPVDAAMRAGRLDPSYVTHLPAIPGWDVAGVVERVGLNVTRVVPGDEVIAYARQDWIEFGTYAERVAAPDRTVVRKPASVGWAEAAGLPTAGATAYRTLATALSVKAGETLLVHAAAGGVGGFAVQIAVALGARVIGTASEPNHAYLRELGAEPVTYGEGLARRVRDLAPDGVDAVADFFGGDALEVSPGLLRRPARLASIVEFDRVRELGGTAVYLSPDVDELAAVARLADDGKVRTEIAEIFPLKDAAGAHRLIEGRHTRGKIILDVDL